MSIKKAIILVGVSGSGKSTQAQALKEKYEKMGLSVEIHSTDNYFLNKQGEYQFDPRKLAYNHKQCQLAFRSGATKGINVLIVDNTNVRAKDRAPYVRVAEELGYEVELMLVGQTDEEAVKTYAARNKHNVPEQVVQRQARRLEASLDKR